MRKTFRLSPMTLSGPTRPIPLGHRRASLAVRRRLPATEVYRIGLRPDELLLELEGLLLELEELLELELGIGIGVGGHGAEGAGHGAAGAGHGWHEG